MKGVWRKGLRNSAENEEQDDREGINTGNVNRERGVEAVRRWEDRSLVD